MLIGNTASSTETWWKVADLGMLSSRFKIKGTSELRSVPGVQNMYGINELFLANSLQPVAVSSKTFPASS